MSTNLNTFDITYIHDELSKIINKDSPNASIMDKFNMLLSAYNTTKTKNEKLEKLKNEENVSYVVQTFIAHIIITCNERITEFNPSNRYVLISPCDSEYNIEEMIEKIENKEENEEKFIITFDKYLNDAFKTKVHLETNTYYNDTSKFQWIWKHDNIKPSILEKVFSDKSAYNTIIIQSDKFTTDPNEIMWEYVKTLINVNEHIITAHKCIDYVSRRPVVIIIQYKDQVLAYIAELPYNFNDELEKINQTVSNCESMSKMYKLLKENYL